MSSGGWIKLYRSTLKNEVVMKDATHLAVWTYLLMCTQNKKRIVEINGTEVEAQAGEFVGRQSDIAEALCISRRKLTRVIADFELSGQIVKIGTNRYTKYKIVNWAKFQWVESADKEGAHPDAKKRTSKRTSGEYVGISNSNVSGNHKSKKCTSNCTSRIQKAHNLQLDTKKYTKNNNEERACARERETSKKSKQELEEYYAQGFNDNPKEPEWGDGQLPDDPSLYDVH